MISEIQAKARELLQNGQVSCFIGYEEGTRGGARPGFVYEPQGTERLIWDERCTLHHALPDHYPQQRKMRRCTVDGDQPRQ